MSLENANATGESLQRRHEKLYINCDILLMSQVWEGFINYALSFWQLPLVCSAGSSEFDSSNIYWVPTRCRALFPAWGEASSCQPVFTERLCGGGC